MYSDNCERGHRYYWIRTSVVSGKSVQQAKRNSKLSPHMSKFCMSNGDIFWNHLGKNSVANSEIERINADRTMIHQYKPSFDNEDQAF